MATEPKKTPPPPPPAPTMREQDEKMTPADIAKIEEDRKEQARTKAEEAAYNRSDMMSGETPPKKMAKGGKVSSASNRADGIAQRGKTRGKYC